MLKEKIKGLRDEIKTLRRSIYRNIYKNMADLASDQKVIDNFSQIFYDSSIFNQSWGNMKWMGTPILKCPTDVWVYQEMVYEIKPDIVIETGTAAGGSAHYFATLFDLLNKGRIVTIDIESRPRPQHPRIQYIAGSSVDENILKKVKQQINPSDVVMVFLDSDHSADHVYKELLAYKDIVTLGSYMVVEDSNVNGHPVAPDYGPGPMEGLDRFLKENHQFEIDSSKEKFILTWNPRGYLKKIRS